MDNYEIKKAELKIQVLSSVAGAKGEEGESMYEIAKKNGFEGTEQEFIAQYMNVDARIGYYECDTDSSTAAKTCQGASFILPSIPPYGGSFKVKFINKNSAANPTLSINQSTPKPLYYNGTIASSTNTWADGDVLDLYYDGTNFNATSVVEKFATGQKVKNVGIDDEPTVGSEDLVKSKGVKVSLYAKKSNDAFISNDLVVQNYDNIIWGKYMSVSDNTIEEVDNNACAYIRLPITNGCKSLFTISDEVYNNVSIAPIFVDENNNYIGSGIWNNHNIDISSVMPENIPDNAAFVYINFAKTNKANFRVFAGLPFINPNNNIVKGDISEVCNCEIFDRVSNYGYINSYIIANSWSTNSYSKVSTPIKCYEGDIFSVSGWCAVGAASDYSKNIFFFNSKGECIGFNIIKQEEYTYTVQSGIDYIAFGFAISSKDTLSIKRIKSGRVTTIIPVDVTNHDSANQTATAIELKGIKYNLQDASLLEKDNNLLKNAVFTPEKYVNSSGVEVDAAAASYTHLSITGKIGYILGTVDGWGNVRTILIFTDGINVLGYTSNINKEVQYSVYGQYQAFAIPSGTTDIYVNVALGHEEDVKLYIGTEEITLPSYDVFNKYLSENLISDIDCKHYWNKSSGLSYNTNIRSSYPITVKAGEEYKYTEWSTPSLGPSSLSTVYVLFDEEWNFLSYGVVSTDPAIIVIPIDSTAKWMILNKIKDTTPTLFKTKLATDDYRLIPDSVGLSDSAWNGEVWCGFGDSLFQQSSGHPGLLWSPYVEEILGLIYVNCGVGGTPLAGDNTNAYWQDVRINAVKATNASLIIIGGGANDLVFDIPIGTDAEFEKTLEQKDKLTFKGAYSYIVETLLTWKPSVRLVLCTNAYAHHNGESIEHTSGLTYADYAQATRDVAAYYGLPVVDWYAEMGINKLTEMTYTSDHIHWNALGSKVAASLVISKLKEIKNV